MLASMAFSSFVIHDDRPSGSRLPREGAEEPEGPEQAQMDVADHGSVPTARPCSLSSKDSRTSSLSSLTINDGATHRRTVSASTLQDNKTHWGKDVDDFGLPSPSIYSTESLLLPSHEIPEPRLDLLSVTRLWIAHTEKIYFSGPVIWRMERGTNGRRSSRRDGWVAGWAQLSGARLSLWDNEEEVVSAPGTEVPTCYVNITDAFFHVVDSVTVPATADQPPQSYANIFGLNTAGKNQLLLSFATRESVVSAAAAFRLSSWERSRLEEIYTAYLIETHSKGVNAMSPLYRGQMQGWVRIRLAGRTDWQRLWMVVTRGQTVTDAPPSNCACPIPMIKRFSNLFHHTAPMVPPAPVEESRIAFYASRNDRGEPLLTMSDVTQAYAVYPERPELVRLSTLIKLQGLYGKNSLARGMMRKEGWLLVMPELEGSFGQTEEMLKWIIGTHDAFGLYGRPQRYAWDTHDPTSLIFAYPGDHRRASSSADHELSNASAIHLAPTNDPLFLSPAQAEGLNPRNDRASAIHRHLTQVIRDQMGWTTPSSASSALVSPSNLPVELWTSQPDVELPTSSDFHPKLPILDLDDLLDRVEKPPFPYAAADHDGVDDSATLCGDEHSVKRLSLQVGGNWSVEKDAQLSNPWDSQSYRRQPSEKRTDAGLGPEATRWPGLLPCPWPPSLPPSTSTRHDRRCEVGVREGTVKILYY